MVKIPAGTILNFVEDEKITCMVLNKTRVDFQGENISLSEAALRALRLVGKNWQSAQGANHWMYEGETLLDRREKFETAED
jgi:hypothetical protein